ncbi:MULTISPECIES: hypothetical protein [unclassified Paraburkholderia]|uniref:hypothetical protein n=1 Tax=unclassified Paraburkholderia TaxID=2615204 RepID=UPI000E2497E3|nr:MULTISPECIES: hypothetical protein [unclassified Paraburkholderia]REE24126.1 hypothetical protein B0G71_7426 [Paraburkholderia sp. BL27I4N3]RKR38257.1 hypothetical protein B0G82_6383 [Paraburkholderia sp. BL17N1]
MLDVLKSGAVAARLATGDWIAMTLTIGKLHGRAVLLLALSTAAALPGSSFSFGAEPVGTNVTTREICIPKGTYPTAGGGTTVFSHEKTCFSRPAIDTYAWEKKSARIKKGAPDAFSGLRIVMYDYHDALYHCAKRRMRLPTLDELKALFAYTNAHGSPGGGSHNAIVASKDDSRYEGGIYAWGGSSPYWSHTLAGNRMHKVVNLADGRVSIRHDPQPNYVSCVR